MIDFFAGLRAKNEFGMMLRVGKIEWEGARRDIADEGLSPTFAKSSSTSPARRMYTEHTSQTISLAMTRTMASKRSCGDSGDAMTSRILRSRISGDDRSSTDFCIIRGIAF
jgi:hypothetical protein